ncbi:hypothetical protein QFZ77_007031 [Paenibacillus sp. V4I3]|jgi:hypothetical protein|nr:hypothetical protein [Paenibacillus sp.]MDQ0878372.1 hypothetical protein [Paenibacillus sp. V4I3]MDQ0885774.1 hypothetical protein [Paenibacillus sp. V4I9]MDQ0901769.1 hypothetical protein [Paenibacillus sp. V4I7]MDQ0919730.1 hypothetical protein [Paenibacillus sp. V4I5]
MIISGIILSGIIIVLIVVASAEKAEYVSKFIEK